MTGNGTPGPASGKRVLFFGKSMSRTRCTGALVDAWRESGAEVRWINMSTLRRWVGGKASQAWASRAFERFRPDLVFVFCRDLPVELVDQFRERAPVVLWIEEALEELDRSHVEYFSKAHLVCLSNPTRIPLLHRHGVRHTMFLMSGFSPRFHRPAPRTRQVRDVAFIGGPGRRLQRAEILATLARRFRVEVFGLHWEGLASRFPDLHIHGPVGSRGYGRVCASSRIVLGVNEVNGDRNYFSNRTWLTLACRGFHLTHYVPGLEDTFEEGRHLAWFHEIGEAEHKIEAYLADEERREEVRQAGHRFALQRHQYRHRIERLLERLEAPEAIPMPLPARRPFPAVAGRLSPSPARD